MVMAWYSKTDLWSQMDSGLQTETEWHLNLASVLIDGMLMLTDGLALTNGMTVTDSMGT